MKYPKIAQFKTTERFLARLEELGISLPIDAEILSADMGSSLAEPIRLGAILVGNRWCIHPMEGWDANRDGSPSDLTIRRWQRFGASGAKLIWGGEAAAVQPDGRANPNQTLATPENETGLRTLRETLAKSHRNAFGTTDDLMIGLQLTHSGRFSRPNSKTLEPRIAYHHPLLDKKFGIAPDDKRIVWTDQQLEELIDKYVLAAKLAARVGFHFVDVKACHGYLLHEFLSARSRPGNFGGDLTGRTRVLRTTIERIRTECPTLHVGVRLSIFDRPPYKTGQSVGEPMPYEDLLPYAWGFGLDPQDPLAIDLTETIWLLRELQLLGVFAVNLTCGSPYYNPHIQRPAIFPPSDGYQPPEDPLVGVARQIHAAAECKRAVPDLPMIGSGYTYLQDFVPQVAQAVVRERMIDCVGLGRMVLSYPELPADTLAGRTADRKHICRTFSDCTTAPRNGIVSGCYPLDAFYKESPQFAELQQAKDKTPK